MSKWTDRLDEYVSGWPEASVTAPDSFLERFANEDLAVHEAALERIAALEAERDEAREKQARAEAYAKRSSRRVEEMLALSKEKEAALADATARAKEEAEAEIETLRYDRDRLLRLVDDMERRHKAALAEERGAVVRAIREQANRLGLILLNDGHLLGPGEEGRIMEAITELGDMSDVIERGEHRAEGGE